MMNVRQAAAAIQAAAIQAAARTPAAAVAVVTTAVPLAEATEGTAALAGSEDEEVEVEAVVETCVTRNP